jgi:hypothetical protein
MIRTQMTRTNRKQANHRTPRVCLNHVNDVPPIPRPEASKNTHVSAQSVHHESNPIRQTPRSSHHRSHSDENQTKFSIRSQSERRRGELDWTDLRSVSGPPPRCFRRRQSLPRCWCRRVVACHAISVLDLRRVDSRGRQRVR